MKLFSSDLDKHLQHCFIAATTAHDDFSLEELVATNFEPTDANMASNPTDGQVTLIIAEW